MMFYHASPVPGIRLLQPHVSEHGKALVYFSRKRENVLVYLSNAIEKHCRGVGVNPNGRWTKWGPYGFDADGILRLEEYYPDALEETYSGVCGYIYVCENVDLEKTQIGIPDAVVSSRSEPVASCETVPDAYRAICQAESDGLIRITRYPELSGQKLRWIEETMLREYSGAGNAPDYRCFLLAKFRFLRETKI